MIDLRLHTFTRPPADLIARAARLRTPDAANALGRSITTDPAIRPIIGKPFLLGPALTVRVPPGDNYGAAVAPLFAEPGDVLVVDTGGDASVAIAGGLLGRLAKLRGLAGLVIDGAIRDLDDLEALGLPIYARAVTPRRAAKAGPADLGGRIRCGGADLTGGDLVLADRDGVVFIPREGLENAITEIEAEVTAEKDLAPDAALISQFEKMLAKAELTRS